MRPKPLLRTGKGRLSTGKGRLSKLKIKIIINTYDTFVIFYTNKLFRMVLKNHKGNALKHNNFIIAVLMFCFGMGNVFLHCL